MPYSDFPALLVVLHRTLFRHKRVPECVESHEKNQKSLAVFQPTALWGKWFEVNDSVLSVSMITRLQIDLYFTVYFAQDLLRGLTLPNQHLRAYSLPTVAFILTPREI
jgi:hypothetical protein